MDQVLPPDAREDLIARGYSRRSFARIAALLAGGAAVMARSGQALAQPAAAGPVARIDANECWVGPFAPAAAAGAAAIATGNRYTSAAQRGDFIKTLAAIEGVPESHVNPWPGSSDPLARVIVTFCSPQRGLVIANPTFELAGSVAQWLGAKTSAVPLTPAYAHDVRAMLAADPNAGVYYICTPNNPTGGVTGLADVEWLVANKPKGSVVLLDEAYIHFSHAKSGAYLAAKGQDVIVLRTFSKIFGMAGMRMGATICDPAITARMLRYDGTMATYALPNPTLATATQALKETALIAARREEMIRARTTSLAVLEKRGLSYLPTDANFFMVDWKKPAKAVQQAMLGEGVAIGRSWPIWPNVSRVTVGSAEDMAAFDRAVVKLGL